MEPPDIHGGRHPESPPDGGQNDRYKRKFYINISIQETIKLNMYSECHMSIKNFNSFDRPLV